MKVKKLLKPLKVHLDTESWKTYSDIVQRELCGNLIDTNFWVVKVQVIDRIDRVTNPIEELRFI